MWLVLIGYGLVALWNYSNRPGPAALVQPFWPSKTRLPAHPVFPTLIMFAHPRFPCSEASLGELNQIMAQVSQKLNIIVVFVTLPGLLSAPRTIPGIQTILDKGGVEADRFGAKTSGQVLLYDTHGKLVFEGGITSARGHSGDNFGKSAIVSFINEGRIERSHTPVFGCILKEHTDANDEN